MKEVIVLLLLYLQSGSGGADIPHKLWTTALGGETQTSPSDLTPSPTAIYGSVNPVAIVESPHPEIQAAKGSILQGATFAPLDKTLGQKAGKKTSTPTSQSNGHSDPDKDKIGISSSRNGTSLQSNPSKAPLLQEVTKSQDSTTGNRSLKQSAHSTDNTSTQQDASFKTSGFETTRGKNWCAYVYTRLLPTVVVDNLETFSSARAKPCTWLAGSCAQRSQTAMLQAYRIKHKIVTSLEWKCCPGYSGQNCQPKTQQQLLIHSNQAESSRTVSERTPGAPQDPSEPALIEKMNEKISRQEMKLTFLQKKVDNIAAAMSDASKMLSSLEGKINEDKGRDFQPFLKGLKSRTINELVKGIVKEQLKAFQNEMQENMAQIFKSVSSLSEDLENTKELVKHLNKTQEKLAQEKDSGSTKLDILELKSHMVQIKEEMTLICDKPMKALQVKQKSLEENLEHQQSRSVIFYESLNKTLTEMKDMHKQLLSTEQSSGQGIPSADKVAEYNVTEYMFMLREKVKKQGLIVLQIYDELRVQDNKISNLSIALEIQRDSMLGVCDDMLSACRKDFQTQLAAAQENILVLNRSVSDLILPLDNKMDKMNEQINDLCYDMEILQPLIEQGAPFSLTPEYEREIEAEAINKKLENLTTVINRMSSAIKELSKTQEGLKNESQAYQELFESRINECFIELEDGLNKTMIVLNNAIDSIQDNYALKGTLSALKNETKVCCGRAEKLDSLLAFIPQVQPLNESLQILLTDKKHEFISQVVQSLSNLPYEGSDKSILHNFSKVYYILNETSSKVGNQQQDISRLEEKLFDSVEESKDHEVRLQSVESKISKFLANNCISLKKNKAASTEKEQMVSLQLQTLSSRVKALEAKSIRFSNSMPLLNKTAHEAWELCQDTASSIQKVNASIPMLIKIAQPDIPLLQRGFKELIESVLEIKAETILKNLTQHVDMSVASAMNNMTRLQKQMNPVIKKLALGKKGTVNFTMAGRSQRNTDNTIDSEQYSACVSSPCRNGGTCVNDRRSFVCACRHPFGGVDCSTKLVDDNSLNVDFSKGSYRYAPMVAFFASHTYGVTTPGPIRFNNLDVNYGASYAPATGKFHVPYLGVYVFEYTIESFSPHASGYLVVDGTDKLTFQVENINSNKYTDRIIAGNALLELNYGQEVWLRLATGSIPAKYPPVTTFSGYLLYRT
ncbi:multimerin-1 [Rhea pennata]|uniref:multimerin-1 n=1 Tax=Rhea pennata TaxID=8795 RepID=UPI002E25CCB5